MWNSDGSEKDKSSFWSGCSEFVALSVGCNEFYNDDCNDVYKIKSESGACRWGVCVCSNSSGVKY